MLDLELQAIIVYIQISREPGGVVKQPGGGIRMVSVTYYNGPGEPLYPHGPPVRCGETARRWN